MGYFDEISDLPADPIFGLTADFQKDPRPFKVNLSIGVYMNRDLQTPVLSSVKRAEEIILRTEKSKVYLPIEGQKEFIESVGPLVLGETFWKNERQRIFTAQTVGGTGALRVGGALLRATLNTEDVFISDPTWPNHRGVFDKAGFKIHFYPYYDRVLRALNFDKMVQFLSGLSRKSVVLFHAGCHNPTGADLEISQWKQLSDLCLENGLIPFFDFAYQGFGRSLEEDAASVRYFAKEGHEMCVATSYSKNFGLYAERVGALFTFAKNRATAEKIATHAKGLIRTLYSNPPAHGARCVAQILSDQELRPLWEKEVEEMREHIGKVRHDIIEKTGWDYLRNRYGMFSFCDLSKEEIMKLKEEKAIYMTLDGRINLAGLNDKNMEYVVKSLLHL